MDWNDEDDFDEEEYADLYADEDEAAELDLQQDIESEAESVDLSRFESSAEKNVFSRRNRIWVRRAVSKPRRHRKSDEKGDWSEAAFPDSLELFRDQERNSEAFEALRSSARDKEVRNFLICGPRGSGKTAACVAYVKDFARPDADPKAEGLISASRGAAAPSRHRRDSSPGMMEVGGLFLEFEAVRTDSSEYDAHAVVSHRRTSPTASRSSSTRYWSRIPRSGRP